MDRTQIYLPKKQLNMLKKEAIKRNTTVSSLVREAITTKYSVSTKPQKVRHETLMEAAKRIGALVSKDAPKDLAARVDYYLYGDGAK